MHVSWERPGHKLFLFVFSFSVVVYATLGGSLYYSLFDYFQEHEDSYLKKIGELCVQSLAIEPSVLNQQSLIRSKIRHCQASDQNLELFFRIRDPRNQTIFNSFPQMYEPFLNESFERGAQEGYRDIQATNFFSIQLLSLTIESSAQTYGTLFIGKRKTSWLMLLSKARILVLSNGLIAFIFLFGLSVAFTLIVSRPLEALHRFVALRKDNSKIQLPKLAPDEIGQLGSDFYRLINDLEGKSYIENYVQTLTHEIKSPLTGIQSAAEILKQDITEEQRKFFTDQIDSESARLHSIIEKMLALTTLEHGKQVLVKKACSLNSIFQDINEELHAGLVAKNMSLKLPEADISVLVDRGLFKSALQNLVENAVEFSFKESEIRVTSKQRGMNVVLEVANDGQGIPDYALKKVFNRFYSLPRPSSGKKSSGLGLCFTKQILELHGGRVELENKPSPQHGVIARINLTNAIL